MPIRGVLCDDPNHEGETYSFSDCLSCVISGGPRRCHAVPPEIMAMSRNVEERADAGLSATMLLGCPRKVILTQEEDYYERPSDHWARFRGTIGHLMMEAYGNVEGIIQEVRRKKSYWVDGIEVEVTGKPDWVDPTRSLIIDFKSTKSISAKPINQGIAKEDHEPQVNVYADLLWGGAPWDPAAKTWGESEYIEIDKGGIYYFDMKGRRKVPVNIWPLEQREAFITARLRPLVRYQKTGEMPPLWMNEKGYRHVLCGYCPVREACDRREET